MLSNIRDAIRAPVESSVTAASGILGNGTGFLGSVVSGERSLVDVGTVAVTSGIPRLSVPRLPGDQIVLTEGLLDGLLSGGILGGITSGNGGIISGVLDGGLLDGGLLENGVLGTGILQNTLTGLGDDLIILRNLVTELLVKMVNLPAEVIINFLEVLEAISTNIPLVDVLAEDLNMLLTQRGMLEIYSDIEITKLSMFRDTLSTIRGNLASNTLAASQSGFLSQFNLGILDGLKSELFDGVLTLDENQSLVQPATVYLNRVFPNIGLYADTDDYLFELNGKISNVLEIEDFGIPGVAKILTLKMDLINTLTDATVDAAVTLTAIGTELFLTITDVLPDILRLLPAIPQLTAEVLLGLVAIAKGIVDGVIDAKLGALEFIISIPIELVATILEIPLSVISDLSLTKLGVLEGLWVEIQNMLGMYNDYTGLLGITSDLFPLENFVTMSRDLIVRSPEYAVNFTP